MSVDLVGSTAFKGGAGEATVKTSAHPMWVDEIGKFYREFPATFRRRFGEQAATTKPIVDFGPRVWKTVGDEIIFCCRVLSLDHVVCVVEAFIQSLDDYGRVLDSRGKHLDVKGAAWLAAFPAPNVTIEIFHSDQSSTIDLGDEELERRADAEPHKFDFLGKSIDCGFRLAKFSSADKLILSAELALALCESDSSNGVRFRRDFNYPGREELKGVIAGRPYPIVTIDTQRSPLRREVFALERQIIGPPTVKAVPLGVLLRKLMEDEGIEPAVLFDAGAELSEKRYPRSYAEFRSIWLAVATEAQKREEIEAHAAAAPDDADGGLPQEVEAALDEFVSPETTPLVPPAK
ncbi:hypothetical protein [Bradyrhizobium sp. DOA1]|uniref:hypothetical protein n=1 Tax=Bradyrhizobium sp. DOA1 TaxID=1126616 RepID=UPI00077CA3E6|nr:hypothetical protein [Bradyrhizobium sp. DOA1]